MAKQNSTVRKCNDRKKYGHVGGPIAATRVLAKDMPHFGEQEPPMEGHALIIINEDAGTYTSANVYSIGETIAEAGGFLGKNYASEHMTHPLPEEGDKKWKQWSKDYDDAEIGDYDVLTTTGEVATTDEGDDSEVEIEEDEAVEA